MAAGRIARCVYLLRYLPTEVFLGGRIVAARLCRVGADVFCRGLLWSAAFLAHIFSISRMFLVFML